MEAYSTVKLLLDTVFAYKDLKSWTLHENDIGTTCTLRFCDSDTNSSDCNETPKITTFKRKSSHQISRDKQRMDRFNISRPMTRSQTIIEKETEELRSGENNLQSLSTTALSPDSVHSEVDSNASFRLVAHSPAYSTGMTTSPSPLNSSIDLPKLPDESVQTVNSIEPKCLI